MSDVLSFTVHGQPVAKGRARSMAGIKDGKAFSRHYTPKETRDYEELVRTVCRIAVNQQRWTTTKADRFRVTIHVYRQHEGVGGDLSNIFKSVEDGIQGEGLAMIDDRYVKRIVGERFVDKARPRVEVAVVKLRTEAA